MPLFVRAEIYLVHDTEERSARILALEVSKRLMNSEKVVAVRRSLLFSNLHHVTSEDLIVAVGRETLNTLCQLSPRSALIGLFVGEQEYQAIQSDCLWPSSAVYSGAPLASYLPLLDQIWLDRRPITLLHSDAVSFDSQAVLKQAEQYGFRFRLQQSESGRVAVLRSVNQATEQSPLIFSFIDTKLYEEGVAQDVLRLLFSKRHLMVGPSLPFVKAGALFSIYSNTDSKLSRLAQMIDYWLENQTLQEAGYPEPFRVSFNPYLIKAYGIVLPTQNYIQDNFGLCSETSCL